MWNRSLEIMQNVKYLINKEFQLHEIKHHFYTEARKSNVKNNDKQIVRNQLDLFLLIRGL